jgi:hypothetical protein
LFDSRQEEEEDEEEEVFVFFEMSRLLLGLNVPSFYSRRRERVFPGVKLTNGLQ